MAIAHNLLGQVRVREKDDFVSPLRQMASADFHVI